MEDRSKSQREKTKRAEKKRVRGNRLYARKRWDEAIDVYLDSLKESPHDIRTLCNLSQTNLRKGDLTEAMEFAHRSLLVNPTNSKVPFSKHEQC